MNLNLDNLEDVYLVLLKNQQSAEQTLRIIPSSQNVQSIPENRQQLNELLDRMGSYLREMAHLDAFIQECLLLDQTKISEAKKDVLDQCNVLCQTLRENSREIIKWTIETKRQLNDEQSQFSRADKTIIGANKEDVFLEKEIYLDVLEEYDQTRTILKDVHQEILVFKDLSEMLQVAGRRLNISRGKVLSLETSHELDVFFDYCLFQYQVDGKTIPERYYDTYCHLHSGKELEILRAFKSSQFSLLKIKHAVGEYGLVVHDELTREDLFMIDRGLSQLAGRNQNHAILTHYLRLPHFIMTTGASTGVNLNSAEGEEMVETFQNLVQKRRKTTTDGVCRQYITELYKIAIHKNVLKTVCSRELPMAYAMAF